MAVKLAFLGLEEALFLAVAPAAGLAVAGAFVALGLADGITAPASELVGDPEHDSYGSGELEGVALDGVAFW